MNLKFEKIINKIYAKQKVSYEEFITLIEFGYEMQFFCCKRKFGSTQFDGFEFYEWDKKEGYQSYKTIEEFADKINIDGILVKDLWDKVQDIDFAD